MKWKPIKAVEYLVIHCSATKEDQDFDANEIRRWHLKRGWFDIGYHFVIKRDGTVEKGRDTSIPGAHARGYNHVSLGICLIGGVESDGKTEEANYTHAQWESLESLVRELKDKHEGARVVGHRDLANVNKKCPSFDAPEWWASRNEVSLTEG